MLFACSLYVVLFQNSNRIKFISLIIYLFMIIWKSLSLAVFISSALVCIMCADVRLPPLLQMKFSTLVSYTSYENWFNQILFLCLAHFSTTTTTVTAEAAVTVARTQFFFLFFLWHRTSSKTHWATHEQISECEGVYVNVTCMTIRACDVQKGFSDSHVFFSVFLPFFLVAGCCARNHLGWEKEMGETHTHTHT